MLFLSPDTDTRMNSLAKLQGIIEEEGMEYLGYREVPTYSECIGASAREAMPHIVQVFIKRPENVEAGMAFERKLFVVLKRSEKEIRYCEGERDSYFYFASLSAKTIVYKGMLTPDQVTRFYLDLMDLDMTTAIALVHSRFSTNTFPSWERAHPNRYIIHNGEINTIRGNVNWTNARQKMFETDAFGDDIKKIYPVINEDGSDSAMLDNYLNMLTLSGIPMAQAVMMAIPEPWENDESMDPDKRAFYEYNSTCGEPWDGPAAIAFTDGDIVGATLDRNGLRPARYYVTKDDMLILSSEVGVLDVDDSSIIAKKRLEPGKMLLIDTKQGKIIPDEEVKGEIAKQHPYKKWVEENLLDIDNIKTGNKVYHWEDVVDQIKKDAESHSYGELMQNKLIELETLFVNKENNFESKLDLLTKQKAFGYTWEDIDMTLKQIVETGTDPIHAMGTDTPLAVLSDKPQLLYNYFQQLFAQVTNPPIDAIREKIVTSTITYLGGEKNLLKAEPQNCKRIRCNSPILTNKEMADLKAIKENDFKAVTISMLYNPKEENGLETALDKMFEAVDIAMDNDYNIIVLSDKGVDENKCAIPALLAGAGVHHHLIRNGKRMNASIILETGEPREVHHFAVLLGYGVNAVNPYLAYETLTDMAENKYFDKTADEAVNIYRNVVTSGIVKIMSKMGISTIQSYQGAQIFEALGVSESVVDKYFTGTVTRIGGIDINQIDKEAQLRHEKAFDPLKKVDALEAGGNYKWRKDGECHMFNPKSIYLLQRACREGDYKLYKEFAAMENDTSKQLFRIRGMLDIKTVEKPINIDEVESVESIVKRFKTGAMSYGSISKEAHECMAIAMNRLGGKSNSGEGGEEAERFTPDENGDLRRSAIKQVASGRFGVTIHYLQNAVEIQIKMAQGAKPGEGGHLPGKKVYPWIAKTRLSTPGVSLISPPPHHDIYSIEDLAQLIYDLKNANKDARISVKLVSEAGVGTIASGVAKAGAQVILISGYDGGTGAAPRSSIHNAGLPWELGLAEAHQTLTMNGLRNKVIIETDGKLMSGRDVAIAAMLGAEEFGFATAPLVTMGCVMMRVCNLDTCPVGIATQNPELRKRFAGKPEYVVNFMRFIAQELREYMAKLGVKTVDELVGRTDFLESKADVKESGRAAKVDLSNILNNPYIKEAASIKYDKKNVFDFELDKTVDEKILIKKLSDAMDKKQKRSVEVDVKNTDRALGTLLGAEITRRFGESLADDTYTVKCTGAGGQSFGAFIPKGLTLELVGDSNDYFGKGLSGGKLIVYPPTGVSYKEDENIIIGNVALYGATSGKAYINGIAGERFCVRNSGATAVVEGTGDHGCEYMTGGRVVVLGRTGKNFAAGMSGGVAYVLDEDTTLYKRVNKQLVSLEPVTNKYDVLELKQMITDHVAFTNSKKGKEVLDNFGEYLPKFKKIMPHDYKKMLNMIVQMEEKGLSSEQAQIEAFYAATK